MPFDGSGWHENEVLQKIDQLRELLAGESRWCKGSFALPDGRRCLVGAMRALDAQAMLEPIVLDAIRDVTGRRCWRIESFNDRRSTTHAQVMRVLDCARERVLFGAAAAPRRGFWGSPFAGFLARVARSGKATPTLSL